MTDTSTPPSLHWWEYVRFRISQKVWERDEYITYWVSPTVPEMILREVTAVMKATNEAAKQWEKGPWN